MSMPPALLLIADDRQSGGRVWRFKSQRSVRTVLVVVPDVNPKDLLEVAAPTNEQPVQALGADRSDPALGVGVRPWCPRWRDQDLGAVVADHVVEGARELRVRSRSKERRCGPRSSNTSRRLRPCCATHLPLGSAVTRPGGHAGVQFDEEQHIAPLPPERVDGEEVAGHDACGLLAQERRPGATRPPRRRLDPWRRSVVRIAVAEMRTPSQSSSPLMRWSPQRGFSLARRTTSRCTSWPSGGRPVWRCG
jgi:hypothetical protein